MNFHQWLLSFLYEECCYPWCRESERSFQDGDLVSELAHDGVIFGLGHARCARQHEQQELSRLKSEFN